MLYNYYTVHYSVNEIWLVYPLKNETVDILI